MARKESRNLSAVEVAHLGPVLEDSMEQLAIMGYLMPYGKGGKGAAGKARGKGASDAEGGVHDIFRRQENLDEQFERVMDLGASRSQETPRDRESFISELRQLALKLQGGGSLQAPGKKEEAPDSSQKDNLVKLHRHREELHGVLSDLLGGLKENGDFQSLVKKAEDCEMARDEEDYLVENESLGQEKLEALQKEEIALQMKADDAILDLNGKIALLKDQIQDQKAKLAVEEKYVRESLLESVSASRDKQLEEEDMLRMELQKIQRELDAQSSTHAGTMTLLKTLYEEYSGKLVHWSTMYDEDTVCKQEQVDALRTLKETDLENLQEMTEKFKEYSALVEEDRLMKEELERQQQQKLLEERSAVKVQAWWRGMLFRHQLGPYSKKKKKKGKGSGKKKGKKGGKKKKKK